MAPSDDFVRDDGCLEGLPELIQLLRVAEGCAALTAAPHASPTCWVAGGALRDIVAGEARRDIDVFFASGVALDLARHRLSEDARLDVREAEANDAVVRLDTSLGRVDLVRGTYYLDALRVVVRFDFVACAAAVDAFGHVVRHRDFEADARARVLRVNALPTPVASYWRLCRLKARGWTIDVDEEAEIVERAVEHPEADGWLSGDEPAKGMPDWAFVAWQALRLNSAGRRLPDVMKRAVRDPSWATALVTTAMCLSGSFGFAAKDPRVLRDVREWILTSLDEGA